MIIHYNHEKPTNVYVINSRLPVYRAYYVVGFGDTIAGLFTGIAPKVSPVEKQLSMKVIDVIRDGAVGDLSRKAFSAAKNKLVSLVRKKKLPPFPSTTVMPTNVSKALKTRYNKN